jgi:hypothetical protein
MSPRSHSSYLALLIVMSNYYGTYNYPYKQNSAPQNKQRDPGYLPSSASIATPQPSRSHAQALPTVASLSTEYTSYSAQPYGGQGSGWSSTPDNYWGGSSGSNGPTDTSSRAAEALRDMSNTGYTPHNQLPAGQSTFTATNTNPSQPPRYSANNSRSPHPPPQQSYASPFPQHQSQARPPSVNTNRPQVTAQRDVPSQTVGNQQNMLQRPESPVQRQHQRRPAAPASSMKHSAVSALPTAQYTDHTHRNPPNVQNPRAHDAIPPKSYNPPAIHPSTRPPGPPIPPGALGGAAMSSSGQSTTTVDPLAVYDPWPEYERKQQAIRAQRAAEEAECAEQEKREEEARQEEQRLLKEKEDEERKRVAEAARNQAPQDTHPHTLAAPTASATEEAPTTEAARLESEIRAMMARMRELNGKDPALLARIWEEERKSKVSKPPPAERSTSEAAAPPPVEQSTPHPAPKPSKNKAASRNQSVTTASKPTTPAPQATPTRPPQAGPTRPTGNTIWPSEQKAHLANAASAYLGTNNPGRSLSPEQILTMLDGNPSYIDLCEQLEAMELKLDRAAFAKTLLAAAPGVNSASRKAAPQPPPQPATKKVQAPPAIMKNAASPPAAPHPGYAPAAGSSPKSTQYPPFPGSASMPATAASPAPVAEAVLIKPEPEPPATKEQAARKRNLSELVDLTQLSDEDTGPPSKKFNAEHGHSQFSRYGNDSMQTNVASVTHNFPSANVLAHTPPTMTPAQLNQIPQAELRYRNIVKPLDRKKALRRNTYNPATIARDVLLASGRHPAERQLNQHLDILRAHLGQISNDSDLSTLKWDLLDPGNPPPGYFKSGIQTLGEDADDEEGSEDEDRITHKQPSTQVIGSRESDAIPEAVNPFKQKRPRGRPPRHSLPHSTAPASPATPSRESSNANMSASAPRPAAAGVGYQAFRSATQYGPDGNPLPKKKGRPVGWRKAIHGSAAAKSPANFQSPQLGGLREDPVRIDSRSPSVANSVPKFKSFKCKWEGCRAELHNLETLRLHVFKVHSRRTPHNTMDCHWDDCGQRNFRPSSSLGSTDDAWRTHVQQHHLDPLSWKMGDGPASGLSGEDDGRDR